MIMDNYSVFFPGYSAGEDAYKEMMRRITQG